MRTSRLSYLFLLPVLLVFSCSREDVPTSIQAPIRFRAAVGIDTKASLDNPTEEEYLISDGNTIGVFATWVSDEGVSTDVFSKLNVSCTDEGEGVSPRYTWDYSPHKYWRQGGQYYFRAVFPYDVNTQFGTDGTRFVTSYSMLADNYDLMVAGAYRDLRTTDDTSPVDFTFKHACAAVRVLFKKGSEDIYRHYLLNSFQMQYLRTVGILAYEGDDLTVDSWSPAEFRTPTVFAWEASSDDDKIDVPQDYESFKGTTTGGWEHWHYVIPQSLTADDGHTPAIQFSVDVKQYESDGQTLAYESAAPVYTTIALPLTHADSSEVVWEPGKTYTYYVQIQPGQVSITVQVTDWDDYNVYIDDVYFN